MQSLKLKDHLLNGVIFPISDQVARVESQGWDRVNILLEFVPPEGSGCADTLEADYRPRPGSSLGVQGGNSIASFSLKICPKIQTNLLTTSQQKLTPGTILYINFHTRPSCTG